MAALKFLSDNLADNATVSLTTGTENAQFPLDNLLNDSPSVKFRSQESVCVILFDLLVTRDIDFVAVAADPLESFLITSVEIKTSTTTDFSMSINYPLDLSEQQAIGYVEIPEATHRYVQVTLTGSGDFTELGKIFIGKALRFELNSISIGSFKYAYKDGSVISQNKYGQKFINKINTVKMLGGDIEFCTKDEQEDIDDMFIEHGRSLPLWMIIDQDSEAMNDGNFKLTIYGYSETDLAWSAAGGQLYTTSVNIRQGV